jgi:hypothetical protein
MNVLNWTEDNMKKHFAVALHNKILSTYSQETVNDLYIGKLGLALEIILV